MKVSDPAAKMVVGLGNPGPQYRLTRHNAGARVVEAFAAKYGWSFKSHRSFKSLLAKGSIFHRDVYLVFPQTYMNLSGEAVAVCLEKMKVRRRDLLVVCDDVSLSLGEMRFRARGSAGGHKGLASVMAHLETKEFSRLRLGIDSPRPSQDLADYVLEEFSATEERTVAEMMEKAVAGMDMWLEYGIDTSMNAFNPKMKNLSKGKIKEVVKA